jgi:hypothetical protein
MDIVYKVGADGFEGVLFAPREVAERAAVELLGECSRSSGPKALRLVPWGRSTQVVLGFGGQIHDPSAVDLQPES